MQMKRSWWALAVLLGASCVSVGCVASAQAGGYGDANAPVLTESPTLVNVDSDVWVVQDANDPIYFVDGYYWTNGNGAWRRTRSYDRGWTVVEFSAVPASIARRDHRAYVRYHGNSGARTKSAPREGVAGRDDDDKNRRKEDRAHEHGAEKAEHKDEHGDRQDGKANDHADRKDDKGPGHDGDGRGDRGDRKDEKGERKDDKKDRK